MEIKDIDKQVLKNPLTKEQAAEQFAKKTKELNLKHAFTFDEAWEIGQELRRKKEFRNKMQKISENFKNSKDFITGKEVNKLNPLKHLFADGCYIREIFNPAGQLILTKIHKKKHPFFLMEGEMIVLTDNGVETLKAPHYGITEPGTQRVIYSKTDCTFITVHATENTNIKEIEKEVIADDYKDPEITLDQVKLIKENI
tara:strand:+ start:10777 stop:11373 length:597 start_codon:yes stop_codon:yes gene_type:complete